MTHTLFRGDSKQPTGREGECGTDSPYSARTYSDTVWMAEIDLGDLTEAADYIHDDDITPADDPAYRAALAANGATWITYADEDTNGCEIPCFRLVRDVAIAAAILPEEDDEDYA